VRKVSGKSSLEEAKDVLRVNETLSLYKKILAKIKFSRGQEWLPVSKVKPQPLPESIELETKDIHVSLGQSYNTLG
jgi:hypothetical protein